MMKKYKWKKQIGPKGAGSFHIHRKTMKELGILAVGDFEEEDVEEDEEEEMDTTGGEVCLVQPWSPSYPQGHVALSADGPLPFSDWGGGPHSVFPKTHFFSP